MKNLYYDLPDDVREIIDKKVKEMELRDALLVELKSFDRLNWSIQRWTHKIFPYENDEYSYIMECIKWFYENEKRMGRFLTLPNYEEEFRSIANVRFTWYKGVKMPYNEFIERFYEDNIIKERNVKNLSS